MAVHGYFMAILIAAAIGGAAEVPAPLDETPLIAADPVLADVNQLGVVLMTRESPEVERLIDRAGLQAQVLRTLRNAGLVPVEQDTETTQRLVVHIEGLDVADSGKYVYRVQTALGRLVTVAGQENRRLQAEVWRVRPAMKVADRLHAGDAIAGEVLVQVNAFLGVRQAARRLRGAAMDGGTPEIAALSSAQASPQNLQATGVYPFIASKSSSVFHRPDCRWAQNISDDNRIGYPTREEALQSGKRPCKSCKP